MLSTFKEVHELLSDGVKDLDLNPEQKKVWRKAMLMFFGKNKRMPTSLEMGVIKLRLGF